MGGRGGGGAKAGRGGAPAPPGSAQGRRPPPGQPGSTTGRAPTRGEGLDALAVDGEGGLGVLLEEQQHGERQAGLAQRHDGGRGGRERRARRRRARACGLAGRASLQAGAAGGRLEGGVGASVERNKARRTTTTAEQNRHGRSSQPRLKLKAPCTFRAHRGAGSAVERSLELLPHVFAAAAHNGVHLLRRGGGAHGGGRVGKSVCGFSMSERY